MQIIICIAYNYKRSLIDGCARANNRTAYLHRMVEAC